MEYLNLVSTLLGLISLLLLLGSQKSSITVSLTNLRRLLSLGNNLLPRGTNNGTLNLHNLTGALLGNLLSRTLLMQTTEEDGPVEFTGILLGHKVDGAFTVQQTEGLAVTADKEFTMAWVDFGAGEVANFGSKWYD